MKKRIRDIILFSFIGIVIYFVFKDDYQEIFVSLKQLSVSQFIVLMIIEFVFLVFDALSCFILLRKHSKKIKFKDTLMLTFIGIFATIGTSNAGTIPIQSYFLYKKDIEPNFSLSAMTWECIFYKIGVLLLSIIGLVFNYEWIKKRIPDSLWIIEFGLFICLGFIIVLIGICSWKKMGDLIIKLLNKLPDKWHKKIETIENQIHRIYQSSKDIAFDWRTNIEVIGTQILRILSKTLLIYTSMVFLNIDVSMIQIIVLSIFMLLIVGFLPHVAGLGPIELSFVILFSSLMTSTQSHTALVLYRIFDYFIPFIMSVFVTVFFKKKIDKEKRVS